MTDAEIRGRLLVHFYGLRHQNGGTIPVNDGMIIGDTNNNAIFTVCQQLADAGLITWKPVSSQPLNGSGGVFFGMAKITGVGVDVVERQRDPPINVRFLDDQTIVTAIESTEISIVPTLYPDQIDGEVAVKNSVHIDKSSADFRDFLCSMESLTEQLKVSNSISGETRAQLLAELKAGLAILEAPKPDPKILDLYLKRPLKYLVQKFADAVIGITATAATSWLSKYIG